MKPTSQADVNTAQVAHRPYIANHADNEIVVTYDVQNADGTWGLQTQGIAKVYKAEQLDRIVRAVNAHDRLVQILRRTLAFESRIKACDCDGGRLLIADIRRELSESEVQS